MAAEYPLILSAVLAAADEHRQAQRLGAAGELLRQALEVWPKSSAIAARLPRTSQAVTAEMRQYADRLMELGLMEYRAGRLESAIAFWQQTLAIDAAHPGARRALDTASLQLKNLQSLK
ncbi:MAG: hypothetical protein IH614_09855 [Desulfuromonadales bacterium]|nr:hypothetical protein [Desulfuromonadales bacterium]